MIVCWLRSNLGIGLNSSAEMKELQPGKEKLKIKLASANPASFIHSLLFHPNFSDADEKFIAVFFLSFKAGV